MARHFERSFDLSFAGYLFRGSGTPENGALCRLAAMEQAGHVDVAQTAVRLHGSGMYAQLLVQYAADEQDEGARTALLAFAARMYLAGVHAPAR